ncbi:MAG: right-handed parallel beta-helix repeat-containing protein, partial [Bacteroidales bacterium]|nr:right-handed parallel beta-helix repeat-containing protein [Bacteroidales bacterium]
MLKKSKHLAIILVGMILSLMTGFAQVARTTFTENFDGNTVSFTTSPAQSWVANGNYYATPPYSYWAEVPNVLGDEIILVSPVYDLTDFAYVALQFKHICKVSQMDSILVEYKMSSTSDWTPLPTSSYKGSASNYALRGFNATSYVEWQSADSLMMPQQSWWKSEFFDVSYEVGYDNSVQFRFRLKRGTINGTQINYGWLIDNFELTCSTGEIVPPEVAFIAPFPQDTVYSGKTVAVTAKVKSNTVAAIVPPYLKYRTDYNSITHIDSVLMDNLGGDTLWRATLPQVALGTNVSYSVTGIDGNGNMATAIANYTVALNSAIVYDTHSVALENFVSPSLKGTFSGVSTPVKVVLRNKGLANLTSAVIKWTVNGVTQPQINWSNNLSWELSDTVTLGNYTPRTDNFDTIIAYVSSPNSVTDNVLNDDTIKIVVYSSVTGLSGDYTVGTGGYFSNWQQFKNTLNYITISGDINLNFLSGNYTQSIDLEGVSELMMGHKLTLTSFANNADSVILTNNVVGVRFYNSNNIEVKFLTIDVSGAVNNAGILFEGTCSDIVVRDCHILANSASGASTQSRGVFKAGTASLNAISLIHNIFDGGYAPVYFFDGTTATNIVFDSNTIHTGYESGAMFVNTNLSSCASNIFYSRTIGSPAAWKPLQFSSCVGDIIGNRFYQLDTTNITQPTGIYTEYHNRYVSEAVIANNELILYGTATSYGLSIQYSNAKILNNSIYLRGVQTVSTYHPVGIYVVGSGYSYVIKYNNIVMAGQYAYPLSISASVSGYDIDHNNLYAPTVIGYTSTTEHTTFYSFRSTITTDRTSFRLLPSFIDISQDLQQSDYTGFWASVDADVPVDINGNLRQNITTTGCYHIAAQSANASLIYIFGWRPIGTAAGQTDTLKAVVLNTGNTTLTDIELHWSINGTIKTHKIWTGTLPVGSNDTIIIGEFQYVSGNQDIKVWVDNIGGTLTDNNSFDDTLSDSFYTCITPLSGIVSVGVGNTYATINDALAAIVSCGMIGDVTLNIASGSYAENVDLTNINDYLCGYSLTFISAANDADSVIILPATGAGFTLKNSDNISIRALTINASTGTATRYGINFTGAVNNILIRDCKIYVNPTTTTASVKGINKETTGLATNVSIIHNVVDGGYSGIYFQGGLNTTAYAGGTVIDSNTITNAYLYSLLSLYTDFTSLSYNTILSRTANTTTQWFGFYSEYCSGRIIGNRIQQRSSAIGGPTGLRLSYFNRTDTGLVANNEIIFSNASGSAGIDLLSYANVKVLYNSIYIGSSLGYGIRIFNIANPVTVKYNNIVIPSEQAYPIYINSLTGLSMWDIDANNLYSPNYAGYAAAAVSSISDWQAIVPTDHNSYSVLPAFVDVPNSLKLTNYSVLQSNGRIHHYLAEVPVDIENKSRAAMTNAGCYHSGSNTDASLVGIIDWRDGHIVGQSDNVRVLLFNNGANTLDTVVINWKINGVSQPTVVHKNMPAGNFDTITLGTINYVVGNLKIEVYISALSSGQIDDNLKNDTLTVTGYICNASFNGDYTIGNANADFPSIANALSAIKVCGVSGDIALKLQSGLYNESVDMTNMSDYMNGYRLTLTSKANNADSATIHDYTTGILLRNSNNLCISALTIDVSDGDNNSNGIFFKDACRDVTIRDCHILGNLTTTATRGQTSGACIKNPDNSTFSDSIFIINNLLEGNTSGIDFYAGTGNTWSYMIIDSNTILNSYNFGIYIYRATFGSLSYNTIKSSNTFAPYQTWGGILCCYTRGSIIGNRVWQGTAATAQPTAVKATYTDTLLVANNEIKLTPSGTGIGIGFDFSDGVVRFFHNSVYIKGYRGEGIVFAAPQSGFLDCRHNNFYIPCTYTAQATPIWLGSVAILSSCIFDYNNLNSTADVGYIGGVHYTSIADWQSVVATDLHSVSILPDFVDTTVNLELANYAGFATPSLAAVPFDMEGNSRSTVTSMGCYHGLNSASGVDVFVADILNWNNLYYNAQSEPIKVIVVNTGTTTVNEITFDWEVNNVAQTPFTWNGTLLSGGVDTITIGGINFVTGNLTLKVNIGSLGILTDNNHLNDTIVKTALVCPSGFSGTYTIGTSGVYATIADAVLALKQCQAVGDVVFELQTGSYTENVNLAFINNVLNGYSLTLTSAATDADSATIICNSGSGITLSYSDNIIIRNITVRLPNTTANTYGINFTGACTNVVVRECKILADTVSTAAIMPIYKASSAGVVSNISFIKNTIRGGTYGFNFAGGTGTLTRGKDIVFDSNTVTHAYSYSVYFTYSDGAVRHNTVLSRTANTTTSWYGLYLGYGLGDIIGNRVQQRSTAITSPTGMYFTSWNTYTTDTPLIINNEVRVRTTGNYQGMNIASAKGKFLFNSIYVEGTTAGNPRGVQIANNAANILIFKYNNIVMTGTGAYPIYLSGITYLGQWDIDDNNMYAPTNVGWAQNAKTSIAAWQTTVTSDKNSVRFLPVFNDVTSSLKMQYDDALICNKDEQVSVDIDAMPRYAKTQLGCYTVELSPSDLMLNDFAEKQAVIHQTFYVKVQAVNMGQTNINSAVFKWSKNGIDQGSSTWTAVPSLGIMEMQDVTVGNFVYDGTPTTIKVWVEMVNGVPETVNWNDTISMTLYASPLAWFTTPFVADTIDNQEFDVYAVIMEGSGALYVNSNPQLQIQSIVGSHVTSTSLPMSFANGKWSVHIPTQYYGSKVIYSLSVSDTVGNSIIITDSTYIRFTEYVIPYNAKNLTITTLDGLSFGNVTCLPDYTALNLKIANTGNQNFDFSQDNLTIHLQVTQPIAMAIDTVIKSGTLNTGNTLNIELSNAFPIMVAGRYDFTIFINIAGDNMLYDDTLLYSYVSGRFGLPIDEDFSNNTMNMVFNSVAEVGNA